MTTRFTCDGKKISLLGFGAMRPPLIDEETAKKQNTKRSPLFGADVAQYNRHIKRLLDGGVTYFDTSPAYCRGEAEALLGDALVASGYARESYVLATKLSNFASQQYPLTECKKMFENSLKFLRTTYVDNYLLHAIGNGGFDTFSKRFLKNGAVDWCYDLRAEKRIRQLGFSYHGDPKTFDWCLEHHDHYKWDFCQIQMNYVDWEHADEQGGKNQNAKKLYDKLTALKIPVVVMAPLLGGRLTRYNYAVANELVKVDSSATLASWGLRFCASFPNVLTVLSGMSTMEQIDENIATFSPVKPCTKEEFAALERAAVALLSYNTIPCNYCNYCMPCPYGLDIPAILTFRNQILTSRDMLNEPQLTQAKKIREAYEKTVPEALRRADHCTGCMRCQSHCPQNIDIAKEMAKIDVWISELENRTAKRAFKLAPFN